MMPHRNPTPGEMARAKEWRKSGEFTTQTQRLMLLAEIIDAPDEDFEFLYKAAAFNLLSYYVHLAVTEDLLGEDLSEDEVREAHRLSKYYERLPVNERREIERGITQSTYSRIETGRTLKPRPLTEIKIATTLGLPCLPYKNSPEVTS